MALNSGFCQMIFHTISLRKFFFFFFFLRLPLKQKKRVFNLLTTLSYLTSCFAAQKLHKQTVRHVHWLARVFCTHIYCSQATCSQRKEMTAFSPCPPPHSGLKGSLSLGSTRVSPAEFVSSTGSRGHGLRYVSPCGLWSQPHPYLQACSSCESNRKRPSIYSHIVFIQRCCFAQIIMSFLHWEGTRHVPFPQGLQGYL